MSSVLKSRDAASCLRVRSFADLAAPPGPAVGAQADLEMLALRARLDALAEQVEQRDSEILELRRELAAASRKAREEGVREGLRTGEEKRAESVARLERGISLAAGEFTQALTGLERLAPLLACEALARIFGQGESHAPLVRDIIRHQLDRLRNEAIVRVEVSRSDFPEGEGADLDLPDGVELLRSGQLKAGDCRIKLRLGVVEMGVDQQWGRMAQLLTELSETAER